MDNDKLMFSELDWFKAVQNGCIHYWHVATSPDTKWCCKCHRYERIEAYYSKLEKE